MNTPISDFVEEYNRKNTVRLHMPGHKGCGALGCESLDITEIQGADALYEANGIIAESEANAATLFDTGKTLYSTQGASQCIRAMLYLACTQQYNDEKPLIVAARNAHKAFLYAAALLDFEILWLWDESADFSLCRCGVSAEQLEKTLQALPRKPTAVYVTSPDYLGGMLPIAELAAVAHRNGTLLLVDNAHGAYLHFLQPNLHPLACGADLCCDSAHKTLPVLTGGSYLHIAADAPAQFFDTAKHAMALFGSTSPSYLILQSLDLANRALAEDYPERLTACVKRLQALKEQLCASGWALYPSDPLRLTLCAAQCGFDGRRLASILRESGIECEYADADYLVLMFTPENKETDYTRTYEALAAVTPQPKAVLHPLHFEPPHTACGVREAMLSPCEAVSIADADGRILAAPSVGCPPAVPIAVSGERITPNVIEIFRHYGIEAVSVVR